MSSHWIALGGMLIQLLGAGVVVYYAVRAMYSILRGGGSDRARLLIAEGVLAALGLMVAGTLLNMLALQTWTQIRAFALVFVLRTLLKRVFSSEKETMGLRINAPHVDVLQTAR